MPWAGIDRLDSNRAGERGSALRCLVEQLVKLLASCFESALVKGKLVALRANFVMSHIQEENGV